MDITKGSISKSIWYDGEEYEYNDSVKSLDNLELKDLEKCLYKEIKK